MKTTVWVWVWAGVGGWVGGEVVADVYLRVCACTRSIWKPLDRLNSCSYNLQGKGCYTSECHFNHFSPICQGWRCLEILLRWNDLSNYMIYSKRVAQPITVSYAGRSLSLSVWISVDQMLMQLYILEYIHWASIISQFIQTLSLVNTPNVISCPSLSFSPDLCSPTIFQMDVNVYICILWSEWVVEWLHAGDICGTSVS